MVFPEIEVDELARRVEDGPIHLIDVREPEEYVVGRVPGAMLVPLATVPDQIDSFRGGDPTYVICRTGARSRYACEYLAERGVAVANVAGGTLAWALSGRDVETGDS